MDPTANKANIMSAASNIPVYTFCAIILDTLVPAPIIAINKIIYMIELRRTPNRCLASKPTKTASNNVSTSIIAESPAMAPK